MRRRFPQTFILIIQKTKTFILIGGGDKLPAQTSLSYVAGGAPSMSSPSQADALLEAKYRYNRFKAHQRQRSSGRSHSQQNLVEIHDDHHESPLSNSWSAPSALGDAVATASPSSVPLSSSLPSDGGAQYLNQHNDDPRYNGEQDPSTRSSFADAEALPSPPLPRGNLFWKTG